MRNGLRGYQATVVNVPEGSMIELIKFKHIKAARDTMGIE